MVLRCFICSRWRISGRRADVALRGLARRVPLNIFQIMVSPLKDAP